MAISDDQYNRLLNRVTKIEEAINDVFIAQQRLVSLSQVNQLLTLVQTQIVDLTEQVDALEARVVSIEEEPLT